jgi:hypothetical protein
MAHYTTLIQRCRQTNSLLADELDREFLRMENNLGSERDARHRIEDALRQKDAAMDILFGRLRDAGVDFSDLIP